MKEYEQTGFNKRKKTQPKTGAMFSSNKVEGIQISGKLHGHIFHIPMARPYC